MTPAGMGSSGVPVAPNAAILTTNINSHNNPNIPKNEKDGGAVTNRD